MCIIPLYVTFWVFFFFLVYYLLSVFLIVLQFLWIWILYSFVNLLYNQNFGYNRNICGTAQKVNTNDRRNELETASKHSFEGRRGWWRETERKVSKEKSNDMRQQKQLLKYLTVNLVNMTDFTWITSAHSLMHTEVFILPDY